MLPWKLILYVTHCDVLENKHCGEGGYDQQHEDTVVVYGDTSVQEETVVIHLVETLHAKFTMFS